MLYYQLFFVNSDLSAEANSTGKWKLKNRSLDLTYDLNYTIWDHLTLTLGIGTITGGEVTREGHPLSTDEVSGYRFISFLSKNFGNWGLIGGYQRSSHYYKFSLGSGDFGYSWADDQVNAISQVGLLVFGVEIGF